MPAKANLYDNAYAKYGFDLYQEIRLETYGEDLGQTSWVTTEESNDIPKRLGLGVDSLALEIGCGSGKYALRVAEQTGCSLFGIDINPHGVANANALAKGTGMHPSVQFAEGDAARRLSFTDSTFDAVFSNDALCHVPGRASVFAEAFRVLKPGGPLLFSDALVIGGLISHQEIATRSSIGYYSFSPPGENERLLKNAGFTVVDVTDTTEAASTISRRWFDARARRKEGLTAFEGAESFEALQRFLACVHTLTSEKRLLRLVYLARKEA